MGKMLPYLFFFSFYFVVFAMFWTYYIYTMFHVRNMILPDKIKKKINALTCMNFFA